MKIVFSAGESSGDQHAAHMYQELLLLRPEIKAYGMGSEKMKNAGIELVYDSSSIAVIGLIEIIKHYSEIRNALKIMKRFITEVKPDLLVCVDYKEFNFNLARFAKKRGIKVLFYVSPQVWAWRAGRVKNYGKVIDMMAVIFPFEKPYYEAENIPVRYVGHPSVDKVKPNRDKVTDLSRFSLRVDMPVVGLLPGSRQNEIKRILPVMLQAAEKLAQHHLGIQFVLPQADSIEDAFLSKYLDNSLVNISVVKKEPYDVIQCCDVIMTCSGTASLEISLLTVPMVIVYKLSNLTYWLGKRLVKTRFIGLPNIIAGRSIIPELIQHDLTANQLAHEIDKILMNKSYKENMVRELAKVKSQLGDGGGSRKMAELAIEMLYTN